MDTIGHLEQHAIDAAIANRWEEAITCNKKIIEQDDTNLGAHLRLGFAYLQNNQIDQAGKAYRKVLKMQPKHPLASENLERIKILQQQSPTTKEVKKNLDPNLFLDVPGKTKTIQLVNLGQKIHLAELYIGQEVELKVKKRKIEVRTLSANYLGALPDDISKRIIYFIESESIYRTYIKEASLSRILIFVKEISKGPAVKDFVSFPATTQPFNHPLHASEGEDDHSEDTAEDWEEEDDSHNDDEEDEKSDLLHIQTGEDGDESEE